MIETPQTPAAVLVAPLDAFGRDDLDRAGGKGANLGELARNGFPVPPGFVVTTDAYGALLAADDLAARIAAHPRPAGSAAEAEGPAAGGSVDDGAAVRAAIEAAPMPEPVRAAVAAAYRELGGGPVAVRSSATAEDLPGAAFAGQQDTYLNVVGEEAVLDAVHRCWASLWTDRAIAYRRRRGVGPDGIRIAVVVQRMADAEAAGVMFTADPVTGARDEIVVDASGGLGEAVVSGLVTPDHYVLDRQGRVRDHRPGRQEVVIRAAAGGGVTHDPGREGEIAPLPAGVLRELATLGDAVAAHFGRPQDIEWARADGRVWLLQARPMTALPPPPLRRRLNRFERRLVPFFVEMLQSRPYPLDVTTWIRLGPLAMVAEMLGSVGLRFPPVERILPEEDGVVARLEPPAPRPTPAVLLAPLRLAARARRHDPARWTDDPRFAAFLAAARAEAERDPASMSWAELVASPRRVAGLIGPITRLRVDYLPGTIRSLGSLHLHLVLLGLRRLSPLLIVGGRTRTADANEALGELAALVRRDPALRRAFAESDGDLLIEAADADPAFRAALDAFLAEYGHRETVSPLLVSAPTWSGSPGTVLGAVRALVSEPTDPVSAHLPERAMARLLAHPVVRALRLGAHMRRVVAAARAGVAFREDTHFYLTLPLPTLRRRLLEIGRRLVAAGVLDGRDDVFHLRLEEIEGISDPDRAAPAESARLRSAVRARAARRAELAGVRMIDFDAVFPAAEAEGALVTGAPAGGGRATGPVRVIREATEFGRLRGGDVLVCPYTNPAWTPLFQRAAAVVVDTGGVTSHAAIVAREYGIPAVMGTGVATSRLTDGQRVTVDGDRGRVTAAP